MLQEEVGWESDEEEMQERKLPEGPLYVEEVRNTDLCTAKRGKGMSVDVQGLLAIQTTKTKWWLGKAAQIASLQSWWGVGGGGWSKAHCDL